MVSDSEPRKFLAPPTEVAPEVILEGAKSSFTAISVHSNTCKLQ